MKVAMLTTDNREHLRDYKVPIPYFGTAPEALLQGFVEMPGVEIHVVSCTQQPMSSPAKLAENIWFHSVHVPKIGWMRTCYQGCIRAVRKTLKKIQPNIVHGQGTERDNAISAVFSGFPNVLTIHGNMRLIAKVNRARPFSYMSLSALLERFTIPRAKGVVCISRYTEHAVRDLARKTWVVPNAIEQDFFHVRRAPRQELVILCVGYVILRKNQNAFIRALDPLAGAQPFKLRFLGQVSADNPYAFEFLDLIKTRHWCEYSGFANRDRLKQELAGARLLALPSLEENCPMVLLEAMAAGVPVAAANVGGVPDLVQEGINGSLFDPTSAESIRTAIVRALENPELTDAQAERAQRQARELYHPKIVAHQHVQIYQEVLQRY